MGSKVSTAPEDEGMPEAYYEGVAYLMEGRYTLSEIEFQKACINHPARPFWIALRVAASGRPSTNSHPQEGDGPHREEVAEDTIIELPIGKEILVIIDYIRMCANIIKAYLRKPKESICRMMAAMHSAQMIVHIQVFFYCFREWRQEHERIHQPKNSIDESLNVSPLGPPSSVEEPSGGGSPGVRDIIVFADASNYIERECSTGPESIDDGAGATDITKRKLEHHNSHRRLKSHKFEWNNKPKEHLSYNDMILFIDSLKAYLRYYWCVAVFNYSVLCVHYVDMFFLSSNKELDANDKARVSRVYDNLMDLMRFTMEEMQVGVSLCEVEEMRSELLKTVPKTDHNIAFNNDADAPEGSHSSSQNMFLYVPEHNGRAGNATYITTSGTFNPVHAVGINMHAKHPVKFSIHYEEHLKTELAVIQPPGEREIFRYVRWVMVQDAFMVPGYNVSLLRRILPEYTPAAGVSASSFILLNKERAIDVVHPARMQEGDEVVFKHLTAFENSTDTKKTTKKDDAIDKGSYYGNPKLDLSDQRIARFINFEECYLVCMPNLIVYAQLFNRCGDKERAIEYKQYVLNCASVLYGTESEEYRFIKELCDIYIY